MSHPSAGKISAFRRRVLSYYRAHRRDFPWRRTHDPYRILVSEVMLQQTQVERVRVFFPKFIARFPTARALARAPLATVLREWQGLGYNRRAKFLHLAAKAVMKEHGGKIPSDAGALARLPGIGKNTAGAVMAFGFNKPAVFIETNIRRTFIDSFFPRAKNVPDEKLTPLVEAALDRRAPREWYSALMDYGSMLGATKRMANPNRRSRVYRRQAPFEGSVRQVRGAILRALLKKKSMPTETLRNLVDAPAKQYAGALAALAKEGMLRISGARITLI